MSIQDKFARLANDNAPGQEVRQSGEGLAAVLRGDRLEGRPVDFSHGDVDAHPPSPGSFDLFAAGVALGGAQAYTEYRGDMGIRETVAAHAPFAEVTIRISGEAFLTEPGALSTLVAGAVEAETGLKPELSTSGGTSDARFIRRLCPVVEFGLPGQSMHKVDELAAVADIEALARIYDRLLQRAFA